MNLLASSISQAEWRNLKCGHTITDHDEKVWEVVYIDHGATRGEIHVAPQGARSGSEVAIALAGNKISVLFGKKGEGLMRPTSRKTPIGIYRGGDIAAS